MANFVSPGVYVIEKDLSNYPTAVNPSVVGVVGFANQGPINKATLLTSQEALLQTFGDPSETITGQGIEGSIEILEATDTLYYVRACDSTSANDASAVVQLGSCPSVQVSATWPPYTPGGASVGGAGTSTGSSLYLDVQVVVNGANIYNTPKQFNIPKGTTLAGDTDYQAIALKKIIGGSLDGASVGAYYDSTDLSTTWITGGYAGSSVLLYVSAFSGSGRTVLDGVNVLGVVDVSGAAAVNSASAVVASGVSFDKTGTNSVAYSVQSLYPGIGYNEGSNTDGTTSGYSTEVMRTGGENVNLHINRDGSQAESFKISLLASGDFAEDVINTGSTSLKSQYIKAYFVSGDTDLAAVKMDTFQTPLSTFTGGLVGAIHGRSGADLVVQDVGGARFNKPVEGSTALAGGTQGPESSTELIGVSTDKTGIHALDDDTLNISMGIVPGIATQSVQNELISLAQTSQNFLAVVAPPYGLTTVQQAIDWSNGQSEERTAAISSDYAAIYWPWVQTYDNFAAKDRWFDPSIYAVRQMAYTDEIGDPWFAPAGVTRGTLTKPTDVELSLNQGDRDSMYSGGNVINPIVNFPQQGIMIFGQRTAKRDSTALDRVNVRRLMIVVRKMLLSSTRRFVFEPNDSSTWEKVVNVVDPLMDDIRRRRGLVDYKVICDDTTNTAIRVDRNEMWCKVLMKPTKAAEVVVFELNLTNQAAQI